jgi:hypothetical protein
MGPLNNLIAGSNSATCFCRYCQAKAREQGISVARAQAGYRALGELFDTNSKDPAPADGYFVVFWRLLLKYPEILSWESLWIDSYQEAQAQLYGTAKAIAPQKPFGFHIMQSATFSPFFRAEEDYAKRRDFADFLKLCTYNNAGGPRMAAYIKSLGRTVFRDAPPSDFLPLYYKMMNYQEATYDKLPTAGLTPDYVAKETKRAVAGVGGAAKIYSGIDIDVPSLEDTSHTGAKRTNPEDVQRSIHAAYDAGADGVVLSRDYVEMWLSNLSAAGTTLREIFAKTPNQA